MSRTLQQLLRPFVPNVALRIRHVQPTKRLEVRFREHLGLVLRGTKAYETHYVKVLRSLINSGDTVFDIGANIGFYSVLFDSWVGSDGRVVAYEPDPDNAELLSRNLELNRCHNTLVREVALAEESGKEIFSVDTVTGSTGHLGNGATFGETQFGDGETHVIQVLTTNLDDEANAFGVPQVIKMDIEGGELDALTGAGSVLRLHRPLIVSELNSWTKERPSDRERGAEVIRRLLNFGYSLWDLDASLPAEVDSNPWTILAVPEEREASLNTGELLRVLKTPLR